MNNVWNVVLTDSIYSTLFSVYLCSFYMKYFLHEILMSLIYPIIISSRQERFQVSYKSISNFLFYRPSELRHILLSQQFRNPHTISSWEFRIQADYVMRCQLRMRMKTYVWILVHKFQVPGVLFQFDDISDVPLSGE